MRELNEMNDVMKVIQQRHSDRVAFDPTRPVTKEDLGQVLEAGRWAPTPHNMQNFEIIVVDDKAILGKIGSIKSRTSIEFLRENYQQLSFSKEELLKKKVGILGSGFPPSWRDPAKLDDIAREGSPSPLNQRINGSPVILIVIYDPRKRAPASEGDVLGFMSLGCVMENMWLMAQSLGLSLQILSVFGNMSVEKEVKQVLKIPEYMRIAYASRLGYPISAPSGQLRVRRDVQAFTHHNRYGSKGVE
jgi:nitroreductase